MYKRIALTARRDFENKEAILKEIVDIIRKTGAEICIDAERCDVPALKTCEKYEELKEVNLIVIVGGDGTILRTVKEMQDFSIPIVAINRGTVGFLTECNTKHVAEVLPKLIQGKGHIEERQLLSYRAERDGKEIFSGHALNEIVVSQGAIARLVQLKTSINGEHLATFRSDGIIVASPTGSTAYSLAAGGAIMHPDIPAILITPLNAYKLTQKPIAIPANQKVEIEIDARESKHHDLSISMTLDGQTHEKLQNHDRVIVTAYPEKLRFLKQRKNTFYETLREKLNWG